jgi:hypothetical protein
MGQYHLIVNLDKKEYLHPHHAGDGLKLWEFSSGNTMLCLAVLMAKHDGGGGGDFCLRGLSGQWAGDRIAIVGDYGGDGIYGACTAEDDHTWADRTPEVMLALAKSSKWFLRTLGNGYLTKPETLRHWVNEDCQGEPVHFRRQDMLDLASLIEMDIRERGTSEVESSAP